MKALLSTYNHNKRKTLEDIIDFHVRFEQIHPFQDGNGRVGRLLLFKECLANGIVPFIITDELKMFYTSYCSTISRLRINNGVHFKPVPVIDLAIKANLGGHFFFC